MKILINTLGIVDSGGVTVLTSLLKKVVNTDQFCLICYYYSPTLDTLIEEYRKKPNLTFMGFPKKSFLHRLYIENIIFAKLIKNQKFAFIYNFSGSAQPFIRIPQIIKLQNMMFFSKKLDNRYHQLASLSLWLKQVWLKRQIFKLMYIGKYCFEVQAEHVVKEVKKYLSKTNHYYIMSDINIEESEFTAAKNYDFNQPLNFLFIVGPHYEIVHKNFQDFVSIMKTLQKNNLKFTITITLEKKSVEKHELWHDDLNKITTFTGYLKQNELKNLFLDNTILLSTSIIETIGLHVIEAIKNGILTIVPDEAYSHDIYGPYVEKYQTYDIKSATHKIFDITRLNTNQIKDKIHASQSYLIATEKKKFNDIFQIANQCIEVL